MVLKWDTPNEWEVNTWTIPLPAEIFGTFPGYCIRCKQTEPPELAHLCDPCWWELRQKAESYGGTSEEATDRMRTYIAALYE